MSRAQVLPASNSCGYDLFKIQKQFGSYQNFNEFIHERGIEKVTGCFCINFGSEDKRNHENTYQNQQIVIDALEAFEGNNLVIMPAGQYYGIGPLSDEALKNAADCMNEVGKRARDKGLWASIHNEFWCAVNLNNYEKFIEMTNPEYVAYCLDTAQVSIMGVDLLKFYDKWHERIKFLHLKDTTRLAASDKERFGPGAEFSEDGTRWFFEVGRGNIDFESLWKLMKKHGFEGWVSIESDGTPDPAASTLLVKNYIDTVLRPIYS